MTYISIPSNALPPPFLTWALLWVCWRSMFSFAALCALLAYVYHWNPFFLLHASSHGTPTGMVPRAIKDFLFEAPASMDFLLATGFSHVDLPETRFHQYKYSLPSSW